MKANEHTPGSESSAGSERHASKPSTAKTRLLAGVERLPKRVIQDSCHPEIGPMMIRYFVLRARYLGIYIHHFLRSDNDRHLHDHPWSFITILLSSGYREHTPAGTFWRRRFSVLWRPAEWQHWVEIDRPVWTLVLRFPRRREWGFITDKGWVDWQTYGKDWCE